MAAVDLPHHLIFTKLMKYLILLFAATSTFAIVGGRLISDSEQPSVVQISVYTENDDIGSCTATQISSNTILTAAHCVYHEEYLKNGDVYQIYNINSKVVAFANKHVFIHPEYSKLSDREKSKHDLAIVYFPDANFKNISPISFQLPHKDSKLTLVGYGKTDIYFFSDTAKKEGPNFLEHPLSEIQPLVKIRPKFRNIFGAYETDLAAPHFGDSGGPLLYKNSVIALASQISVYPYLIYFEVEPKYTSVMEKSNRNFINSVSEYLNLGINY